MEFSLQAHAKINLTLKVLGKRGDGYHQVEMVMQSLILHDILTFTSRPRGIILTVQGQAPGGNDNLVYRAAELVQGYSGVHMGASINLKKNIPMEAGLAGGSADAASTIVGLNRLWELNLSTDEMLLLAERLGSDVPFCISGGTVLARGKGEQLTPLNPAPEMGVVLVKPYFGVSTAEIYQKYKLETKNTGRNTAAMLEAINNRDIKVIAGNLFNDLESVTVKIHPVLQKIKDQLMAKGVQGTLMSGSGPTIYGLTPDAESAVNIAGKLDWPNAQVIATTTYNPASK